MSTKESIEQIKEEILPVLDRNIRQIIAKLTKRDLSKLTEIRLRAKQPLIVELLEEELLLTEQAKTSKQNRQAYHVSQQEIEKTLALMTESSFYRLEDEFKAGYLTLAGGHRVGMVGEVIKKAGQIERIKNISGLNIRISREIIGAANQVLPNLIKSKREVYNTLILGPPGCGKTTLLRDLARQISNGIAKYNLAGLKVGVVDERSEIGGAYCGVSQNKLGIRTDLLDKSPKAEGMMLLIRAMSPEVLITDELGLTADFIAAKEALNAGVKLITTMHAANLTEAKRRPDCKELLRQKLFSRIIILSNRLGPGTIEEVIRLGRS